MAGTAAGAASPPTTAGAAGVVATGARADEGSAGDEGQFSAKCPAKCPFLISLMHDGDVPLDLHL